MLVKDAVKWLNQFKPESEVYLVTCEGTMPTAKVRKFFTTKSSSKIYLSKTTARKHSQPDEEINEFIGITDDCF